MTDWYIEQAFNAEQLREAERRRRYNPTLAREDDSEDDVRDTEYYGDQWRGYGPRTRPASGPYAGYGPRGYQRSDQRIQDEVCDLLTQDGEVDARDIEVSVQDGEVTLKGSVDSRRTKRRAEDVVDAVYGVRDVHNELHIQTPSAAEREHKP